MAIVLVALCFFRVAEGCTIPVFRYALDRWAADSYRLEFPTDALKDGQLTEFFRNLGNASPVNLEGKPGSAAAARLIWPHPEEAALAELWTGTLTPASLATLTDSPARKELARRVLAGESVVWVLVESGHQADDDVIAARVEKRLRYLEQVAILPRIDPNDPSSKLGPGPALRVKFSLLRVPSLAPNEGEVRGEGAAGALDERIFLKMLAGPRPHADLGKGAWLAALFGRGRVLGAWPAVNLGDAEIEEACLFLLGACSCQVKRQNPGWDLLMTVAWDRELVLAAEKSVTEISAPVTPVATKSEPAPETVTIAARPAPPAPQAQVGAVRPVFVLLGAVIAFGAAVLLLRSHRKS